MSLLSHASPAHNATLSLSHATPAPPLTLERRFELLERQIAARTAEALFFLHMHTENEASMQDWRFVAWATADAIGFDFPDLPSPPAAFDPGSELEEAFFRGKARRLSQDSNPVPPACHDNTGLLFADLPSARDVLHDLLNQKSVDVAGHTLSFDVGVTWFTNPYGVDGALGNTPTLGMITTFLTRIAEGVTYGPVPH